MSDKFTHNGNEVFVTTPSGKTWVVAEVSDVYWADAIAYALNFTRTEEW